MLLQYIVVIFTHDACCSFLPNTVLCNLPHTAGLKKKEKAKRPSVKSLFGKNSSLTQFGYVSTSSCSDSSIISLVYV